MTPIFFHFSTVPHQTTLWYMFFFEQVVAPEAPKFHSTHRHVTSVITYPCDIKDIIAEAIGQGTFL